MKSPSKKGKNSLSRVALLQNILESDEDKLNNIDVSPLILENKLEYYEVEVFTGNWKSGNGVILICTNVMSQLIKNKFTTNKNLIILNNHETVLNGVEDLNYMIENRVTTPSFTLYR